MPVFSVVIPTYNRKSYLEKAVCSVLEQTFPDWELIIVDDGSNDGTGNLISAYKDKRIKYIYQQNKGVASARNRCILESKGEYICPLDSDDWWDKDKLKIQKQHIDQSPQYKIFHTQEIWYRNGILLNQKNKHKKPSGVIFPHCLPLCCVSISTACIHKSIFSEIGMFDENLPACEDYDFWLRVSLKYPVYLIDKPLTLKDGGRPDQLSQKSELDKYRIIALTKFMEPLRVIPWDDIPNAHSSPSLHPGRLPPSRGGIKDPSLTKEQSSLIRAEFVNKIKIYLNGCIKRNKINEKKYYSNLLKQYETADIISCR